MSKVPPEPAKVFVGSHTLLFETHEGPACDACGKRLPVDDDDGEGYGLPGSGTYVWRRGDRAEIEKVPLCASCASAVGMTALARWEIEEEEG